MVVYLRALGLALDLDRVDIQLHEAHDLGALLAYFSLRYLAAPPHSTNAQVYCSALPCCAALLRHHRHAATARSLVPTQACRRGRR